MNKLTKIKVLNVFFQFLNSFNLLFAGILFTGAIYLIAQTGIFNSFVLSMFIIAFFICFTSFFSFCCTYKAPCAMCILNLLLILIFILVIIMGFCIVFIQDQIINFLIDNMNESSQAAIEEAREKINNEMDITKIVMLAYSIIIVKWINIVFRYSCRVLVTKFDKTIQTR
jgi:hypothetical protein